MHGAARLKTNAGLPTPLRKQRVRFGGRAAIFHEGAISGEIDHFDRAGEQHFALLIQSRHAGMLDACPLKIAVMYASGTK